jgi:hypothetical protein
MTKRDFLGNGSNDWLWYNSSTGAYEGWDLAGTGQNFHVATFIDLGTNPVGSTFIGTGDPDGDGHAHVLFEQIGTPSPFDVFHISTTHGAIADWTDSQGSNSTTHELFQYTQALYYQPYYHWDIEFLGHDRTTDTRSDFLAGSDAPDFNGDHRTDLLAIIHDTSPGPGGTAVTQDNLEMVTDGTFYRAGWSLGAWQVKATADFNGDGTSDILWRNASTSAVEIWAINKDLNLADHPYKIDHFVDLPLPSYYTLDAVGDFHHDGSADLLMHNTLGEYFTWNFVNGQIDSSRSDSLGPVGQYGWSVAAVGDYNGDGTDDIAWQNNGAANAQGPLYEVWSMADGHAASFSADFHVSSDWHMLA